MAVPAAGAALSSLVPLRPAWGAGSGPAVPVGVEFQVNGYTTGSQSSYSVATAADGGFVVVWQGDGSPGGDTSDTSIQAQRYDGAGSAVGSQFQVNTYTTGFQSAPSVAAAASGDFAVVWESLGSPGSDSSAQSIQAQRYSSAGGAVGSQFQVNTYTTNSQVSASAAVDADGDLVVVWRSFGVSGSDITIQGQRYSSAGSAVGGQFQVSTYTTFSQRAPSVAAHADGAFVVVWASPASPGSDASGLSVQGQRYSSAGSAVGGEFQVNTYTTGAQQFPSVAAEDDGDFVVVWTSYGSSGSDAFYSIQGQRYSSAGNAVGGEFQVNTYTTSYQFSPSVTADADGDFVVVWTSDGSSGSDTSDYSIQGQRYASAGIAVGSEFQVNTYTTDLQESSDVAAAAGGDFVVVWTSNGSSGSDASGSSVQGQRYAVLPLVPSLSAPGFAAGAALVLLIVGSALRRRS